MKLITDYIELHVVHFSVTLEHSYLLLKRSDNKPLHPGIWQMITGAIEDGESVKKALVRELKEETGLIAEKIYSLPRVNSFYAEFCDGICLCPVFLAVVNGNSVSLSDEHSDCKWLGYHEAIKMIRWEDQVVSLEMIEKYLNNKDKLEKLPQLNFE